MRVCARAFRWFLGFGPRIVLEIQGYATLERLTPKKLKIAPTVFLWIWWRNQLAGIQ